MSGPARKRGAGRATRGQPSSETSSRRGDRLQPGGFAGGYDGPASRGSASNVGSGHGGSPTAPQGGFAPQAPSAGSRRSSQSGGAPPQPSQPAAPRGDPARESQPRYTDQLRNVDLPASFYNIDQLVSQPPSMWHTYLHSPCLHIEFQCLNLAQNISSILHSLSLSDILACLGNCSSSSLSPDPSMIHAF